MGRRAQKLGSAFEKSIEMEELQVVEIFFKVPTAKNYARKTWLDYVGCTPEGRFVTFDAKWVGNDTHVVASVLSPFQRRCADLALASGALVGVYVGAWIRGAVRRFWVPWSILRAGRVELDQAVEVERWELGLEYTHALES